MKNLYFIFVPESDWEESRMYTMRSLDAALGFANEVVSEFREEDGFCDEASYVRIYRQDFRTFEMKITHESVSNGKDNSDPECEYRMVEVSND